MIDKQSLLKKFINKEEKILISKALDQYSYSKKAQVTTFTDFIDPIKSELLLNLINSDTEIYVKKFGGSEESERSIIGFSYDKNDLSDEQFPINSIEIKYNTKFSKGLTHREFLGSILGLGIERSKVGDILIFENRAIVFILDDIVDYVVANLEKVSNTKVICKKINMEEVYIPIKIEEEIKTTVTSLRLDNIIASVFHMSRSKASDLIESEKVFINWVNIKNSSKQISENDTITVRGIGRIKINELIGKSKKDKFIISVTKT